MTTNARRRSPAERVVQELTSEARRPARGRKTFLTEQDLADIVQLRRGGAPEMKIATAFHIALPRVREIVSAAERADQAQVVSRSLETLEKPPTVRESRYYMAAEPPTPKKTSLKKVMAEKRGRRKKDSNPDKPSKELLKEFTEGLQAWRAGCDDLGLEMKLKEQLRILKVKEQLSPLEYRQLRHELSQQRHGTSTTGGTGVDRNPGGNKGDTVPHREGEGTTRRTEGERTDTDHIVHAPPDVCAQTQTILGSKDPTERADDVAVQNDSAKPLTHIEILLAQLRRRH